MLSHRWPVLMVVLLAGCGATQIPAPRANPELEPSARVTNERLRRPRPLVAPPPAYGNRVVEQGQPPTDQLEDESQSASATQPALSL